MSAFTHEKNKIIILDNATTHPLDQIRSTILQIISQYIFLFITTIINCSIRSSHVWSAFKRAMFIPNLKKPTLFPSDISNYQLVSPSWILECAIDNLLTSLSLTEQPNCPFQWSIYTDCTLSTGSSEQESGYIHWETLKCWIGVCLKALNMMSCKWSSVQSDNQNSEETHTASRNKLTKASVKWFTQQNSRDGLLIYNK